MGSVLLDAAGHRRLPATMPGYHYGRAPRDKGLRCPADPVTIEELIAVMRAAGERLPECCADIEASRPPAADGSPTRVGE
jgi:hypothetical protein